MCLSARLIRRSLFLPHATEGPEGPQCRFDLFPYRPPKSSHRTLCSGELAIVTGLYSTGHEVQPASRAPTPANVGATEPRSARCLCQPCFPLGVGGHSMALASPRLGHAFQSSQQHAGTKASSSRLQTAWRISLLFESQMLAGSSLACAAILRSPSPAKMNIYLA